MQNYVGQQIDRYRITERLGMGGMAVVYKAYDTRLERDVAIKVIRTKAIPAQQHDRLLKRFEREAKTQAQFKHPNIVPIFDYGVLEGSPYLVMPYIPGGTLKDRIKGPMDYHQAIEWILPIADALQYAHEHGIVHRDVKPSNILINQENQSLLTDFGIAKILDTQDGTLTSTGMGVGTPEYMAPEQWKGQSKEASDQYALAVVLYELLTGQKPYTAETPVAIALKQMNDPLIRPSVLAPGIPEQVEKVLFKALARDPKDRYLDIYAFQQALVEVAGMRVEVQKEKLRPFAEKPDPIGNGIQKNGWIWAITSVMIVAIVGFLGFIGGWNNILRKLNTEDAMSEEVSGVSQTTATLILLPSPTSTQETLPKITEIPTVAPTPKPNYSINYINADYQLIHYDLSTGQTSKVIDLVPSENQYAEEIWERFSAMWSKGGEYLLYAPRVTSSSGYIYSGIYLYDLINQEQIIIADGLDRYRLLGFSPDYNKLVYSSYSQGVSSLFLYDIEKHSSTLIIIGSRSFIDVEWNTDGTELYFVSDEALYSYNSLTNEKEIIVEASLGLAIRVILSPDGSQLYIYSTEEVTQWLSIIDLITNELHRITSEEPYWDFSFWSWETDNPIITGSWIGDGGDQGKFIINTENYQIQFYEDEKSLGLYYHTLILENREYSLFWFTDLYSQNESYCLKLYDRSEFNLLTQICSNDYSNLSVSEDKKYLFIQRSSNQIHQIDSSNNLATTILAFDDGVLSFQLIQE